MAARYDWDRLVGFNKLRRLSDVAYSVRVDLNTGQVILVVGNDPDNPDVQLEFDPEVTKKLSERLAHAASILLD